MRTIRKQFTPIFEGKPHEGKHNCEYKTSNVNARYNTSDQLKISVLHVCRSGVKLELQWCYSSITPWPSWE
jgi:hypothetical protein